MGPRYASEAAAATANLRMISRKRHTLRAGCVLGGVFTNEAARVYFRDGAERTAAEALGIDISLMLLATDDGIRLSCVAVFGVTAARDCLPRASRFPGCRLWTVCGL